MQYFGVPRCPYCKKRVNLVRTWSLKREGEYRCPRCGGISNVFLSPLVYVLAVIAVFAGAAIYFFHKFILDDVNLSTAIQVLVPFAVFFLGSLFTVYLAKPVIKKVSRAEMERKKRRGRNSDDRRAALSSGTGNFSTGEFSTGGAAAQTGQTGRIFNDYGDYSPRTDYATGPVYQPEEDVKIHTGTVRQPLREQPVHEAAQRTAVLDAEDTARIRMGSRERSNPPRAAQPPAGTGQNRAPAPETKGRATRYDEEPVRIAREAPKPRPAQSSVEVDSVVPRPRRRPDVISGYSPSGTEENRPSGAGGRNGGTQRQAVRGNPVEPQERVVSSVEIPNLADDFFAKYDDPDYVNQRLEERRREKDT